MHYDVFNGDADGICALIQLRLDQPIESTLVTGIKRDIQLLDQVKINAGDSLTVLDISFEKNNRRVIEFLNAGAAIFYVDHHQPGDIPKHPHLTALIETDNSICSSLLVNRHLNGKYPLWAVTAAFGDNLNHSAEKLAYSLSLAGAKVETLKNLGIYINYNGYGNSIADLHFAPDDLYREMVSFDSPFGFISENPVTFEKLENGYRQDMANAENLKPEYESKAVSVFLLPDKTWARRVSGVFGNHLANLNPNKAHAVVSYKPEGGYLVSIRAPLSTKTALMNSVQGLLRAGGENRRLELIICRKTNWSFLLTGLMRFILRGRARINLVWEA